MPKSAKRSNVATPNSNAASRRATLESRYSASDVANAGRLLDRFGERMRYCHVWKRWLIWDGKRWEMDQTGAAMRFASRVAEYLILSPNQDDGLPRPDTIAEIANHHRLKAMLTIAAADLPIVPEEMDRDPWLFNCENGTLDLRTGELHKPRQRDYITRLCPVPYDPNATCEAWQRFLATVFVNPSLIEFMQRLLGYCLTGEVGEQVLPIFWGEGANGKSTLVETMLHVLGRDYSMKAPPDLLIVKRNESHPTERADLFGKRFVACVESGQGRGLNEAFVKELTGNDTIRARRLFEDFWEFRPTHKVVLCTNHCPEVRGVDHAIWRRLTLVPFSVTFWDPDKGESGPDELVQDKSLLERLKSEAPGILAWCVQGCREWQRERLKLPDEVVTATLSYRYDQDSVANFVADCCILKSESRVKASSLYTAYEIWCLTQERRDIGSRLFGEAIVRRFERIHSNGTWYKGLELAQKSHSL